MYKKILGEILMPVKGKKGWDSIKSQWISDSKLRKKGGLGVSILECSEVLRKIQQVCKEFSSVQFSCSVVSDSLQPHGLQHTRLLCPSQIPRAYSISCPSSRSCHPTISSSVVPLSSCPQSFPASKSFSMSRLFASGGQSIICLWLNERQIITEQWQACQE